MISSSLPDIDSSYALSEAQISQYRKDGHIYLPSILQKDEVAPYAQAIRDSAAEFAKNLAPLDKRDTYGKAFIQHMNLWLRGEEFKRYTLAKRFAKVAADLMGVAGVRIYHDQALFKEPGGGYTPWHQDQQYWPLDGVKAVTMWMPLVDLDPTMGTLIFASGSHEIGYLGSLNISDESEQKIHDIIAEKGYTVTEPRMMSAGDATFHDGWVFHGAPGNSSTTTMREAMTVIFFEDGAKISHPDSPQRENDMKTWFPGLQAGDLAASEINPIAYP